MSNRCAPANQLIQCVMGWQIPRSTQFGVGDKLLEFPREATPPRQGPSGTSHTVAVIPDQLVPELTASIIQPHSTSPPQHSHVRLPPPQPPVRKLEHGNNRQPRSTSVSHRSQEASRSLSRVTTTPPAQMLHFQRERKTKNEA